MKTAVLLVILCLGTFAMAEESSMKSKLNSLLAMQAKAADAVDTVYDLLKSLKQQNLDTQAQADKNNASTEERYAKLLGDLKTIADQNKASGDAATAHRKHIENEIEVTNQYLVWINQRRAAILKREEDLREQRCYANELFIKSLKEHDEALKVIALLREDVAGVIKEHGGKASFAQFSDISMKIKAYAHLFNEQAMAEFTQLADDSHAARAVDAKTGQYNDKARDNEKGALTLESGPAGTDDRSLGQKFLDLIDKLEQHMKDSIKDLEANEIQAAWDLATWLQDSAAERNHLDSEQERKKIYIDKLLIAIVAAKAHEDKTWEIYFKSATALNDAKDDLAAKRAAFWVEKLRRDEENQILDMIYKIFEEQVAIMDKGIRGKSSEHYDTGKITDASKISSRAGDIHSKSAGQVGNQVAAASRN